MDKSIASPFLMINTSYYLITTSSYNLDRMHV